MKLVEIVKEKLESETKNTGKLEKNTVVMSDEEKSKGDRLLQSEVKTKKSDEDRLLQSVMETTGPGTSVVSEIQDSIRAQSMEDKVEPPVTLIDLAHAKAKDVFDIVFHLVIAQALLFFQHRNCEIDKYAFAEFIDLSQNKTGSDSFDNVWDLYDCDVAFELRSLSREMQISLGIASYSFIAGTAVVAHAIFMKNRQEPPIQGIFKWTDRIPIIDSIIEIPLCLWVAPFRTLLLWVAYILCCAGLVILVVSYEKEAYEDGNLSAFALTACLVGFDLYRLTGNIAQYYVINKSANKKTREEDKKLIEKLTAMHK